MLLALITTEKAMTEVLENRIDELNPFEDSYIEHELAFYDNMKDWTGKKAKINIVGGKFMRVDDFFNTNMRQPVKVPCLHVANPIPALQGKWELAMSLSHMEMQSSWLPILEADGVCATAGLGLGYYALRVIAKEEVEKLWIFERNEDVVQAFEDRFTDREGYDKCEFIVGSAREHFQGYDVDHCFMDIYHTMMPDELIDDTRLFLSKNNIGVYHPWCLERIVLDAVNQGVMSANFIPWNMRSLFRMWTETEIDEDGTTMDQMYEYGAEPDYCENVITALADGGQDWAEI